MNMTTWKGCRTRRGGEPRTDGKVVRKAHLRGIALHLGRIRWVSTKHEKMHNPNMTRHKIMSDWVSPTQYIGPSLGWAHGHGHTQA